MKKVCVVTTTRAEYDGLYPLLKMLRENKKIELRLVVTGAHLSHEFGFTYEKIKKDNFLIHKKIDINLDSNSAKLINKSMARELFLFADYFSEERPDLIIIMGDRYELLPICAVCTIENIPIAHISGGELTLGAIDDNIRHAITKLSHFHFVANKEYKKRVIQLGEEPKRVFAFGELSLENILKEKLLSKKEIEKKVGLKDFALVTFHPETLKNTPEEDFNEVLKAIKKTNLNVVFTKSNADNGGKIINKMIKEYVNKNENTSIHFSSMGRKFYLSAMKYSKMILGNSSSGIYEAPSFLIPTVNIGDRQKGRIMAKSIINCKTRSEDIIKAIKKAENKKLKDIKNPYGNGKTSRKIVKTLENLFEKNKINIKKKFYDINF